MRTPTLFLVLLTMSSVLAQLPADTLAERPLVKEIPLLGDRFTLDLPAEARVEPRAVNIMSAPPSDEAETRVVIDLGPRKCVLFAQDLMALTTKDLVNEWRMAIDPAEEGLYRVSRFDNDRLTGVEYSPREQAAAYGAILLRGCVLEMGDGTLVRVDGYLDEEGMRDSERFARLVERIFATARPGRVSVDLRSRRVKEPLAGADSLRIDLPAGHVVHSEAAHDFRVHRISRILPLNAGATRQVIIYNGHHPSPFAHELELPAEQRTPVNARLWGKEREWDSYVDPDGQLRVMECVVDLDDGTKLHVALLGSTAADMDEQLAMVATLLPVRE